MTFMKNVVQFTGLFVGVVIGSMTVNMILGTHSKRMPTQQRQQDNQQKDVWDNIAQQNYSDK